MTNITFYVKSDKSIIGFKSKGHAGFGAVSYTHLRAHET